MGGECAVGLLKAIVIGCVGLWREVTMSGVPTIEYARAAAGACPLCGQRAVEKKLFGEGVCKKCLYGFANRRQLAYIVDVVLLVFVGIPAEYALDWATESWGLEMQGFVGWVYLLGLNLIFVLKDGFDGRSPGKRLTGVQVVDEASGKGIGFLQSFKRNVVLMVGLVPVVGGFVSLVVLIVIAIQMNKGRRLGDGITKTRVIWKRYERSRVFGGDGLACEGCGYDLRGNVSGKCSECGKEITDEEQKRLVAGTVVG